MAKRRCLADLSLRLVLRRDACLPILLASVPSHSVLGKSLQLQAKQSYNVALRLLIRKVIDPNDVLPLRSVNKLCTRRRSLGRLLFTQRKCCTLFAVRADKCPRTIVILYILFTAASIARLPDADGDEVYPQAIVQIRQNI